MLSSSYKAGAGRENSPQDDGVHSFILPNEIPIDPEATLDQLTSRFRSVRNGLPELIKTSKDQYSRLRIMDAADRQIVVVADTGRHTLAVLDFAGAPADNFQGWTKWSDPAAGKADLAADIEAGHGNGGKAFMVRGATKTAFLESCFRGRRTRKGFVNDQPGKKYKPGFAIDSGVKLDAIEEDQPTLRLEDLLASMGASIEQLPEPAKAAFSKRNAYTMAYLEQVAEWTDKRKQKVKNLATRFIPEIIATHGQTAMTIETCQVWVMVDRKIIGAGPIRPVDLEPYPGFEEAREFEVPDILPDPETGEPVDVLSGHEGPQYLRLHTSAQPLRMSPETKAKNVIRVWNNRNNVATWQLQGLHGGATSSFIFGKLCCPSLLDEHLAGADRHHLSDTPLSRALEHWTKEKIEMLANDLHLAMAKQTRPKDRERARTALSQIRDLMRRYLDPDAEGDASDTLAGGTRSGRGKNGQTHSRDERKFGPRVDEIRLEPDFSELTLICGTKVPLIYRCIEQQDDGSTKPVRQVAVKLRSEPEGQFELDSEGMLAARTPGIGEIWLETSDGSIQSNRMEVWVGEASSVELDGPNEPLLQGQRVKLRITFHTPDGPIDDALIDGEVLDQAMGIVGRHGRFTAGLQEGVAVVRVRYGSNPSQFRDFEILIGSDSVTRQGKQGNRGGDVPEILFCGDTAPGMEEFPPDQRTHLGGEIYPTIIEEPHFRNIVWINPRSKEALRVRGSRGGSSGLSGEATKTFLHFVALKCFDILKRLHVRQQIAEEYVTEYQYMQYAVEAEMDCAEFIDAAWELSDQLLRHEGDFDG
jgi:hypothetical protein